MALTTYWQSWRPKGSAFHGEYTPLEFISFQVISQYNSDHVRNIMYNFHPEGFDKRFPGRGKVPRKPLTALGIWHSVSGDGHEKLSSQALDMGPISLPIYAFKEKWSNYLLHIVVAPNVWNAATIGLVYLDFIEKYESMLFKVLSSRSTMYSNLSL